MASPTPPPVPAEQKALMVRVAEALGCKPTWFERPDSSKGWSCTCMRPAAIHNGYNSARLLPYGDDTPEGWACTGGLMVVRR